MNIHLASSKMGNLIKEYLHHKQGFEPMTSYFVLGHLHGIREKGFLVLPMALSVWYPQSKGAQIKLHIAALVALDHRDLSISVG